MSYRTLDIALDGKIDTGKSGGIIRNTFETTAGLAAACDRGRAWPSRSRTQAAALGGAKRKPEDAEMRSCHVRHPGVRGREAGRLVPDAPVSKFTLEMQGGAKGLLVNSENICAKPQKALAHFIAQNGRISDTEPALRVKCPKGKGRKGKGHKRHGRRAGRKLGGGR